MKKITFLFIYISVFCLNSLAQTSVGSFVPGEMIVQLKPGLKIEVLLNELKNQNTEVKVKEHLADHFNVWLIEFDQNMDGDQMMKRLSICRSLQAAEFNHYIEQRNTTPNDANFSKMWGLDNIGGGGAVADADIDAPEAWDISTGGLTVHGDTIVVAVVDGGFDINHQDIHYWKNRLEIPGNGVDDDVNGYIDDFNGWHAINNNGTITSDQHGTHVAGTVGAKGNNAIGVTGVNWNVRIMPIVGSSGQQSVVVKAYNYIFKMRDLYNQTNGQKGAFIVSTNSSFGVDYGQPSNFPLWCGMYDSLGRVGILSAGATSNSNVNVDTQGDIPTACPSDYLVTVTNTTKSDARNSSCGYGVTTIDLGAPGTEIWSTLPGNTYAGSGWTGTSMATPHVAGAIALMYSAACSQLIADYKATPGQIALLMKDYIMNNTDGLASLSGKTVTGGRLNIYKMLQGVQSYICPTGFNEKKLISKGAFNINFVAPNPVDTWTEIEYILPTTKDVNIQVINILGQEVLNFAKPNSSEGVHRHKLDLSSLNEGLYFVTINNGNAKSNTVKVVVK